MLYYNQKEGNKPKQKTKEIKTMSTIYVVRYPHTNEYEYFGDACAAHFFAKQINSKVEKIKGE